MVADLDGGPRILHVNDMGPYEMLPSDGLAVSLGLDLHPAPIHSPVVVSILALHAGLGAASGVEVTRAMPAGLAYVSNSLGAAHFYLRGGRGLGGSRLENGELMNYAIKTALVLLCLVVSARGGFIFTETWDATDAGWTSGGGGFSGFGFSLGAMGGTFGAQDIPSPGSDAFHADSTASGGAFTGNYWTDLGNFYGWSFQFYAEDILPSSLYMRFGDGVNTYQANLLSQVGGEGNWYTLSTPGLTFGLGGWLGGGGLSGLSNALASVEWLELRLDRNQGDEQTYFVDNFTHLSSSGGDDPGVGDDPPPGDGGGNAPEPGTLSMGLALAGLSLSAWGRRRFSPWRNR